MYLLIDYIMLYVFLLKVYIEISRVIFSIRTLYDSNQKSLHNNLINYAGILKWNSFSIL